MVQYSPLDQTFSALADGTRRRILERLADGEATITDLAAAFSMTLTGMKKHIAILERAELVSSEKRGRTRYCRLGPRRLDDARQWIDLYRASWEDRFGRLDALIAQRKASK